METLLIGAVGILVNILTIVLLVVRVQVKNREDITRLETHIANLKEKIDDLKGKPSEALLSQEEIDYLRKIIYEK